MSRIVSFLWKTVSSLLAVALAVGLCASAGRADIGGSVSGTVTDAAGAVVAGATITAIEVETSIKLATTTDSKGSYSLRSCP